MFQIERYNEEINVSPFSIFHFNWNLDDYSTWQ